MNDDERYMRDALREAGQAAAEGEIPIGAVVVCRGRVISRGHNMTERLHDPSAHAEMIALTAATEALGGKYLTDCTLYVTVEPCPMCSGALNWAQLGALVYGAPDPKRGWRAGRGMFGPRQRVLPQPPLKTTFLLKIARTRNLRLTIFNILISKP